MTERQAKAEGLQFTGHYESTWDKDKLKTIAAAIRKLYKCRVVMVNEGHGYSLYAGQKYQDTRELGDMLKRLSRRAEREERARERYQAELKEISDDMNYAYKEIAEIKHRFPELTDVTEVPDLYDYLRSVNAKL